MTSLERAVINFYFTSVYFGQGKWLESFPCWQMNLLVFPRHTNLAIRLPLT